MFWILVIFFGISIVLGALLYISGLFLQGYFYTEPDEQLWWRAPAAGAILGAFYAVWCLLVFATPGTTPTNLPYDTIFRFSPQVEMFPKPAERLWAYDRDGNVTEYKRQRIDQTRYQYVQASNPRRTWDRTAQKMQLVYNDQKLAFEGQPPGDAGYRAFLSESGGWEMREYEDGPSGMPSAFRWFRFLMNLLLNIGHLALWIFCFWFVMQFHLGHAAGLGTAMWGVATLVVLPLLLPFVGGL